MHNPLAALFAAALLCLLVPTALAIPYNSISTWPKPYWNPTAGLFYHRCSSPTQVEWSKDMETWLPSAICLRGTCCSNLSKNPNCSKEACELADKELRQSETNRAKDKPKNPEHW
jgi:hypothetical protein